MKPKLKPLHNQVIVITGASSGIGLATAQAAAQRGASLVLASRSIGALEDIASQINAAGGRAIAVECDVADREEVENVARAAIAHFGRIDTWINDAGVSIYARLDQTRDEDARRLFDTNFWMYSASKHAVKGYTDALRVEIEELDKAPVSITLIQPTAVDTPFPQHAKNDMPREPKLPTPQIEPAQVAEAILDAAIHPVRDKKVGAMSKVNTTVAKVAPGLGDKMAAKQAGRQQYDEPAEDPRGALHRPSEESRVVGQTHGLGGPKKDQGPGRHGR
jgi:short-subunit dehydrogenase